MILHLAFRVRSLLCQSSKTRRENIPAMVRDTQVSKKFAMLAHHTPQGKIEETEARAQEPESSNILTGNHGVRGAC